MNRIEKLLQKFCPDGVEFKALGEVTIKNAFKQIGASELEALNLKFGNIKLLPSSQNYDWWSDEKTCGKYICNGEVMTLGRARNPNLKYYNGKFVSSNNIIIQAKQDILLGKFLYYLIAEKATMFYVDTSTYPKFDNKIFDNYKIPIPPLEIQKEIVLILDAFTELQARQKQYEHYRERLLSFDELERRARLCASLRASEVSAAIQNENIDCHEKSSDFSRNDEPTPLVKMMKFGEFCEVKSGGTPSKTSKEYWNGEINWVKSEVCQNCLVYENQVKEKITDLGLKKSSATLLRKNSVLIAMVGATIGKVGFLTFESATNQNIASLYPLETNQVNSKFVYYQSLNLYPKFKELNKYEMANLTFIRNLQIPIPPLKVQNEVVEILDKFDALVNDISQGLPAEMALRKKQYEHYREKLLSFKEKA